jgi:CDP-diglyceride synthetase
MEFLTRTVFAVPMAGAALLLGVWGNVWTFSLLLGSSIAASGYEVCSLYNKRLQVLSLNTNQPINQSNMLVCIFLIIMYSAVFAKSVFYLRNFNLILFLFLVVWATDVSALLIGKLSKIIKVGVGGPRLLRFISEHKTISGCIGGVCGGTLVGLFHHAWLNPMKNINQDSFALFEALKLSVITSCAAVLGDLLESAFKRSCQTKDSDVFIKIPGHGGILDRLDSILCAAPVCAVSHYVSLKFTK